MRVTIYAEIKFPPGGTSATLSSPAQRVSAEGVEVVGGYTLRAAGGQTMDVRLSSPNGNILLTLFGADGTLLKRYVDGTSTWQGTLPSTQEYVIHAVSVGPDASFTLYVSIPPLTSPTTVPGPPIRIEFPPGGTFADKTGRLSPGATQQYVLRAMGGQRMEVYAWPQYTFATSVRGTNGSQWSAQPWQGSLIIGSLPLTQDYVISLSLPSTSSQAVDYTMRVIVPPP
jgi:hypothetical protein